MKSRIKAIYAASGLIAGAGALAGAMMTDVFGYDAVGWTVIPTLFIFAVLFFYWAREDAICQ